MKEEKIQPEGLNLGNQEGKEIIEESVAEKGVAVKIELLGSDFPIIRSLDELYIEDWKKEATGDKQNRKYFYMSDVGRCRRRLYYDFHHSAEKHDMKASTITMFTHGGLFHDEIQQKLKRLGLTTAKDVEFGIQIKAPFFARGRIDAILHEDGKVVIMEIKSKNPYAFGADVPNDDEVDQLMTYIEGARGSEYFQVHHKEVADYGYLLYIDRSGMADRPIKCWKVYYSKERVAEIYKYFEEVNVAIEKKEVPDRMYERSSTNCSYCRYQSFCWKDIPLPPEPKLEKDETIEPPEQELVESVARSYVKHKKEEKEIADALEREKRLLMGYYKGTGNAEIVVDGTPLKYVAKNNVVLNVQYLMKYLKDKWHLFSKPSITALREAVKSGAVSATVFEKSKDYVLSESIRIGKGGKDAD